MISLLGCCCRLVSQACLPSWFLFWASWRPLPCWSFFMVSLLGCSWLPLPPCLPSLSPFMIFSSGLLLAAAAALSPKSLFSWSPFWAIRCRCRVVSSLSPFTASSPKLVALSPKLVSLHDFPSGLRCRCRLIFQACLPSWFPFWAALGCRLVSQACLPSWFPFWALGRRCRRVFQACPPSWFPCWAVLGSRCRLVSQACLPSWFPF